MRAAALFVNGIGDHLMVLPALRALARLHRARLTYFGQAHAIELIRDELPGVAFVALDWSRSSSGAYELHSLDSLAREGGFDRAYSLVPWENAHLRRAMQALRAREWIGLTPACDASVDYRVGEHTADLTFRVVRHVAPDLRMEAFSAPPTARALGGARRHRGPPLLAVHDETLAAKVWPLARLRHVLARFRQLRPEWEVVYVGRRDLGLDRAPSLRSRRPPLPLRIAFARVASASAFVGVDSCMLHLADLHRVPSVALFGPPATAPLGAAAVGLRWATAFTAAGAARCSGWSARKS